MSSSYIGQIIMFGGNFAIRNWAFCSGASIPIQQNMALFAVLGTTYGGNGTTNFLLPDLRSRVPLHPGAGAPGLTPRILGQAGGTETTTLTANNMPAHAHTYTAASSSGAATVPIAGIGKLTSSAVTGITTTTPSTGITGGTTPVPIVQPFLAVNFLICLIGLFPPRS